MDHPAIDRDSLTWRKSSYSGYNGNCAEVAQPGGRVLVRDSKDPGGPVLVYSPAEWMAFLGKVKAEPVPTKVPDLSGVPLGELGKRERGATFSSSI